MRFSLSRRAAAALAGIVLLSCTDATGPRMMNAPSAASLDITPSGPNIVIVEMMGDPSAVADASGEYIKLYNPGPGSINLQGLVVRSASGANVFNPGAGLNTVESHTIASSVLVPEKTCVVIGNNVASASNGGITTEAYSYGTSITLGNNTTDWVTIRSTGGRLFDSVAYSQSTVSGSTRTLGTTYSPSAGVARRVVDPALAHDVMSLTNWQDVPSGTTYGSGDRGTPNTCSYAGGGTFTQILVSGTPSVEVGATTTLTAIAADAGGNAITPQPTNFVWSTDKASVATVNNGVVTGVAAGTANITVESGGITKIVSVTVTPQVTDRSGTVVISQIYGGGGNASSNYKNDFIELFNTSSTPIDVTGWSVQQTSNNGASWSATPLSGIIQPNTYYLVQGAAGTTVGGGTTPLPTPDATGTLNLGAASGKVLLAQTVTPFAVACPSGNVVVILVGYGTGTNCGNAAPTPDNATAAARLNQGCFNTNNPTSDFVIAAPTPRNSSSTHSCVLGPVANVTLTGSTTVLIGTPIQLTAKSFDSNGNQLLIPIVWTSADPSIATVSSTGLVSGVSVSDDPVIITATASSGGVTVSASALVTVNNPGGINWLDISYNSNSLPAGFQATFSVLRARDGNGGTVIPATFSIEALDPDLAVVLAPPQGDGTTIAAIAAPSDPTRKARFRITATPTNGGAPYVFTTGASTSLTVEPRVTISTSLYGNNEEFGDPTPASTSTPNDFLIRRDQHTLSYNQSRGTPNWVSYEIDSRQLGGEDRCNCFTADAKLPVANQIFYGDYTNGGYDRGHMQPSADRTGANVDNASTFYMTNMVPQVGGLNQGVWANLENALRDSVRAGRAAYILVGPLYSRGKSLTFLKNGNKVAIPDSTWKIALIGPRDGTNPFTRGSLQSWDDLAGLSVMAVNMPNFLPDSALLRKADWHTYLTTVDKIEEATGYDFLSLLTTAFQDALEAGDHAPVAKFSFTGTQLEGSSIAFDGSASTDQDIGSTTLSRTEALSYQWHFGDGTPDVTGKTVSHTFADNGTYDVTLMVTDVYGWQRTLTKQVAIANVNPSATFAPPTTGVEGSVFSLSLTGANDVSSVDLSSLTYAFDCGNGSYSAPQTFATFNCTPPDNGTYTVRAKVIDKDGGFTEYTGSLTASNANPSAVFSAPNVNEGSAIVLTLSSATDPSAVDAASLKFAFDCGSGFGDVSSSNTASCPTTDNGSRTVRGRVIDKDGGRTEYSTTVAIANVAPTGALGTPASVEEGSLIPVSITDVADVSSDDATAGFSFAYDCGAGFAAPISAPTASCPTSDNGTRTIRIRIIDKDGGTTELSRSVTVTNATPTVSLSSANLSILSGQTVSVTGGFTDPGADSPWQYVLAWGVGANTTGAFTTSGASTTASRQYLTAGSYTVSFAVTDKDGASSTKTLTVWVGRRSVVAEANPNVINLNDTSNGDMTVKLYSDANVDISKVDVASVRIGTVGVIKKSNGSFDAGLEGGDKRLALKFDRSALIAAGVLTAESTELVITATLTNGVQIQGRASITAQ